MKPENSKSAVVEIFTDGACKGNPGPGAWAALLRFGKHEKTLTGAEPDTTNNRMEMTAAIRALEALKKPCSVRIATDSKYLMLGITEWLKNWKARGWQTSQKKPVKNEDLWRILDKLNSKHHVEWGWVQGHFGHKENEQVDKLARNALRELLERNSDRA